MGQAVNINGDVQVTGLEQVATGVNTLTGSETTVVLTMAHGGRVRVAISNHVALDQETAAHLLRYLVKAWKQWPVEYEREQDALVKAHDLQDELSRLLPARFNYEVRTGGLVVIDTQSGRRLIAPINKPAVDVAALVLDWAVKKDEQDGTRGAAGNPSPTPTDDGTTEQG